MNRLDWFIQIVLLVVLTGFSSKVLATDLGVIGPNYGIAEKDLIDLIQERIAAKTANGELDQLNKQLMDKGASYARRPQGIQLPRASNYSAREIDPTYTVQRDITDSEGRVIVSAGTEYNPLDIRPMSKTLCFIDGDDVEQVKWLKTYCLNQANVKSILISGDYLALSKHLNARIYFDQRGYLVQRFGITAVPAVIRQGGRVLYAEEFPVN